MNESDVISKVSISSTNSFRKHLLSPLEIESEKKRLVEAHVNQILETCDYSDKDKLKERCLSHLFFIDCGDTVVLCGLYKVHRQVDVLERSVGYYRGIKHYLYDYLLYNVEDGFYFLIKCSGPVPVTDTLFSVSPSIYKKASNETVYSRLEYKKTYLSSDFYKTIVVYNRETYYLDKEDISGHDTLINIEVLSGTKSVVKIDNATLFSELPLATDWLLYTTEKSHMKLSVPAKLINYITGEAVPILCEGGYHFEFNYNTTTPYVLAFSDESNLRISDDENIYFYISRNDSIAFDAVWRIADKYGNIKTIPNLLKEDASLNYQICFSRDVPRDVLTFVHGVIHKSNALWPVILGCPIHDVFECFCKDCKSNPYDYPGNNADELSALNVIEYLKGRLEISSNEQLARIIVKQYGSYSAYERHYKNSVYEYRESIACEYLPVSIEPDIGIKFDRKYVYSLKRSKIKNKWKSELSLYRMIYKYYPDAIYHYGAPWLGKQHLDIFIPCLAIGIEYQGEQHYKPNDYFGGERGFANRKSLDTQKQKLCEDNNVVLIRWPYDIPITISNLFFVLKVHGITSIPIPDSLAVPPEPKILIPHKRPQYIIRQYSDKGVYVQDYESYDEASRKSGVSKKAIQKVAYGYRKSAGGWIWKKVYKGSLESDIQIQKAKEATNQAKPIVQISIDGEIVGEFDSIKRAVKETGINGKSIRCVLSGVQKTAGGFRWSYNANERSE